MQPNNPELYTASGFIQNIFLVQAWTLPTTFSWNSVAWAVSTEWLAYLCFPLVLSLTLPIHRGLTAIASIVTILWTMTAACLLLDSSWTVPYGAGSYGLIRVAGEFTAGCLLYNLYTVAWGNRWRWGWISALSWLGAIIGSIVLNGAKGEGLPTAAQMSGQLNALWLTPLFALAIYSLAWEKGIVAKIFSTPAMQYGGHFSYALYLTHFLCLILLRKIFPASEFASASMPLRVALIAGYLTIMVAAAVLTYRLIEEPGRRWMKHLNSRGDKVVRTSALVQRAETTAAPAFPTRPNGSRHQEKSLVKGSGKRKHR